MKICTIGIDLGKTVFHLISLDEHGKLIAKKKCSRSQLLAYTANIPGSIDSTSVRETIRQVEQE